MLDSYFEEVRKRRSISRIFWITVFIFGCLLYSFFKGYYFSFKIGLKAIIPAESNTGAIQQGTSTGTKKGDSVFKQFGVVHMITRPSDISIFLDTDTIDSGERKMVNYGDYTMQYQKTGYFGGQRKITINQEIPYYMDSISLVSTPVYSPFNLNNSYKFSHIEDDVWLTYSQTGALVFSEAFQQKIKIPFKSSWKNIGNGYVWDSKKILQYNRFLGEFRPKSLPHLSQFLKNCKNPQLKYDFISCQNTKNIINFDEKIFEYVVERGKNYIKTPKKLWLYNEKGTDMKQYLLTGSLSTAKNFIHINDDWYFGSGSQMKPLNPISDAPVFSFPVDMIFASKKINDYFVFLGKKDQKNIAIVFDPKHELEPNIIDLPNIDFSENTILAIDDTIFIKTQNALLFFYKKDSLYHMILEGKILAFGKNYAIYIPKNPPKGNQKVWRADWKIGR